MISFATRICYFVVFVVSVAPLKALQDDATTRQLTECPVTVLSQTPPSPDVPAGFWGNKALSVSLASPTGTLTFYPGGAGIIGTDGSLAMKFGWNRGTAGALSIEGHRLDAISPPLQSRIPSGYGEIGFQSTQLIFPTPGCWEVRGRVADASLTFVTRVLRRD